MCVYMYLSRNTRVDAIYGHKEGNIREEEEDDLGKPNKKRRKRMKENGDSF